MKNILLSFLCLFSMTLYAQNNEENIEWVVKPILEYDYVGTFSEGLALFGRSILLRPTNIKHLA